MRRSESFFVFVFVFLYVEFKNVFVDSLFAHARAFEYFLVLQRVQTLADIFIYAIIVIQVYISLKLGKKFAFVWGILGIIYLCRNVAYISFKEDHIVAQIFGFYQSFVYLFFCH